jgi:alkylation response protein AidB-like acyl-CoA dehydrogenase
MFRFELPTMPPAVALLRSQVREFLAAELATVPLHRRANSWTRFDAGFSRRLAGRGWVGMTWPKCYGGRERSALERYVVLEELLVAGAPVGAHWFADRQSGPALLRFGTEDQRQRLLPGMARAEVFFCIGMSEPNAGSDLAAVRTRADRLADGRWRLNGQKLWTTNAHRCQFMIALVRTAAPGGADKHAGLSQFLIELGTPGVRIAPIVDLVGERDFCEVFFEDVVLDPNCLLGEEGRGWQQCTSELSLERSGPERYLSSLAIYLQLLRRAGERPTQCVTAALGVMTAEMWTLRQMSLSVAGQLSRGEDPALEAAVVKDLGNSFEQALPGWIQSLAGADVSLEGEDNFSLALAHLLQVAPSFSLRGGTREILRGIIARGLGVR